MSNDNSELMLEAVVDGSVKEMDGGVTEDAGKSFSTWSPCTGFTRLERFSCKGLSLVGSLSVTTVGVGNHGGRRDRQCCQG